MTFLKIAANEVRQFVSNPLVIIVSCILLGLAVLNGIGTADTLRTFEGDSRGDVFLNTGLSQLIYSSTFFCTIVAVSLGAMSMTQNRLQRYIGVLLTKPLYRRDVVAGKFIGLNILVFAMVAANQIIYSLIITVCFRPPLSLEDFALRLTTYILLLFFEASACVGLMMLIGTIFHDVLKVTLLAITFLYIDWYSFLPNKLDSFSVLSPKLWAFDITQDLLKTSISYTSWLGNNIAYILLIIVTICLLFLIECYVFARSDKV